MTTMELINKMLVTVEYELIKDTFILKSAENDVVPMAAMIKTKLPLKQHACAGHCVLLLGRNSLYSHACLN